MKRLALTSVVGSVILFSCFQLSTAAPTNIILAYIDTDGVEQPLRLTSNECINLDKPLKNVFYSGDRSTPAFLYPTRDCNGLGIYIDRDHNYNGFRPIISVKKASTP